MPDGGVSFFEVVGSSTRSLLGLAAPVMELSREASAMAARLAPAAGRIAPIASAVFAAGVGIKNVKESLERGDTEQAIYEGIVTVPDTVANLIPFAGPVIGSGIREGLRAEVVALGGEAHAPQKSFLRRGWEEYTGNDAEEPAATPAPAPAPTSSVQSGSPPKPPRVS